MKRLLLLTVVAGLTVIVLISLVQLNTIKPWKESKNAEPTVKFQDYLWNSIGLKLKLPDTTKVKVDANHAGEIVFNAFLMDEILMFKGYIQIWQVADLEKFLEKNKAESPFKFTAYQVQKVQVKNLTGYRVDWNAEFKGRRPVAGREYFVKNQDKPEVLRISIFADESPFPKRLEQINDIIISSLEWN